MKTEKLLEKYFDGQTTCEEERALRRFFASDQVPEHLEVYRPLFACIDQEVEAFRETQKEEAAPATHPAGVRKPTRLYRLYYLTTGIAAALLLCIGIAAPATPSSTDATATTRNWYRPRRWKPCRTWASRKKNSRKPLLYRTYYPKAS